MRARPAPRCGSRAGRCQQLHQHNVRTRLGVSKNSAVSQFFPERLERRLGTWAFSPSRQPLPTPAAPTQTELRLSVAICVGSCNSGTMRRGLEQWAGKAFESSVTRCRQPAPIAHALDFSQRPSTPGFPGASPGFPRLQGSYDGQISANLRGLQRASEIRVGYHAPGEQS